jgi:hypothetical protein
MVKPGASAVFFEEGVSPRLRKARLGVRPKYILPNRTLIVSETPWSLGERRTFCSASLLTLAAIIMGPAAGGYAAEPCCGSAMPEAAPLGCMQMMILMMRGRTGGRKHITAVFSQGEHHSFCSGTYWTQHRSRAYHST